MRHRCQTFAGGDKGNAIFLRALFCQTSLILDSPATCLPWCRQTSIDAVKIIKIRTTVKRHRRPPRWKALFVTQSLGLDLLLPSFSVCWDDAVVDLGLPAVSEADTVAFPANVWGVVS